MSKLQLTLYFITQTYLACANQHTVFILHNTTKHIYYHSANAQQVSREPNLVCFFLPCLYCCVVKLWPFSFLTCQSLSEPVAVSQFKPVYLLKHIPVLNLLLSLP